MKLRGYSRDENKVETAAPQDVPAVPKTLDKIAVAEWHSVCAALSALNLLSSVDRTLIESYCQNYSRIHRCEQHLKVETEVITTTKGDTKVNPWANVLDKELARQTKYLELLGLTPMARMRINPEVDPTTNSVLSKYVG